MSYLRFIKTEENSITSPPTDSLNTKTERVNSCTVNFLGACLIISVKHPQVEHHTWLPSYQPNEKAEQHIIRAITEGSEISVRDGSFKEELSKAEVLIEVNKNMRHIITATST